MNKVVKTLIAILGGVNVVFNIFIPISISLLLVSTLDLGEMYSSLLLIAGGLSSVYKGIEVGFLRVKWQKKKN